MTSKLLRKLVGVKSDGSVEPGASVDVMIVAQEAMRLDRIAVLLPTSDGDSFFEVTRVVAGTETLWIEPGNPGQWELYGRALDSSPMRKIAPTGVSVIVSARNVGDVAAPFVATLMVVVNG